MDAIAHMEQSKAAFLYYFQKHAGNISLAVASVAKTRKKEFRGAAASRSTYYRWVKEDPEFAAACDDVDEANLDAAESCIMDGIKAGDRLAAQYLLDRKGRKRGYDPRPAIDNAGSLPHVIRIVSAPSAPPVLSEADIVDIDFVEIPASE